jgi:hypothetical protein
MKMGNEKIRTVAMDNFKNDNSKRVLFVDFMELRFPEEGHIPYIQEWADRFKTGHPTTYMDEQSQRDYKIVFGINGEEPKTDKKTISFSIGDTVIYERNRWEIIDFSDNTYTLDDGKGNTEYANKGEIKGI